MARRSFLILHGWEGSERRHWQSLLRSGLEAAGETVAMPMLGDPCAPDLDAWLADMRVALEPLPGERTVICHSLACLVWLHHAASAPPPELRASRVLLAAPPCGDCGEPALASFFPVPLEPRAVAIAAHRGTRLLYAADDPYCRAGADEVYGGPLGVATEAVPGGGHLNPDAGYGPWPSLLEWCLGERATVT